MNILIIEDSKVIAEVISRLIKKCITPKKTLKAHSLKEARKQLELNKFDIVFLDLNIEKRLDGIILFKDIKEKHNDTPVIVVTSEADKKTVSDVIKLEPKGYIIKPLSMLNIERSIYSAIRNKQNSTFD